MRVCQRRFDFRLKAPILNPTAVHAEVGRFDVVRLRQRLATSF
jgi:hypothetical protein